MSERPVALVTGGARRLGRAIALELAAHGWDVALHYRESAAEAQATLADVALAGRPGAGLRRRPRRRGRVPCAAARGVRALRPARRGGEQRSRFEHDDVAELRPRAHGAPLAHQRRRAVLLARALHAAEAVDGRGCVVNLLDQKLWNPNPDYLSYTCRRRRWKPPHAAGAGAGAARAGVRRRARRDAAVGPDGPGRLRARPPHDAAAALVHAATSRARCASCWTRRPSPAPPCWSTAASTCAPAARRDVPRRHLT
jgi:hypothetical protein